MRAQTSIVPALLAAATLCACNPPDVAPGLDQCSSLDGGTCVLPQTPGVVKGNVVYSGSARGDAVLLLFSTNALPPPDGTATNAAGLARIPAAALFGSASASAVGPFSAPFIFTQVPPGTYQIRAFIDVAGEFDPFFDYTQQPRAGDPVGGLLAFDGQGKPSLASLTVVSNQVADGVNVAIGAPTQLDPPAFVLADATEQPNTLADPTKLPLDLDRPLPLRLKIANPNAAHANLTAAHFAVELRLGPDGLPQQSDRDGLDDVWPRVLLRQMTRTEENGTYTAVPAATAAIVPAKVIPMPVLPLLRAAPLAGPLVVDTLDVLVEPFAVQLRADGTPLFLPSIPAGTYQLVVIERSGQAWTLPNALAPQVPSQATTFEFVTGTPPAGAIQGVVHYSGTVKPGNLIVQAYRADAASLAPPVSVATPARVQLIAAGQLNPGSTGFDVAYSITSLPAGRYYVLALDDADGNFSPLNLLATATKGDLTGAHFDANGRLAPVDVTTGIVANVDVTLIGAPGKTPTGQGFALDPPAFSLDETAGPAQIGQDARGTVRLTVAAGPPAFPVGAGDPQATLFTVGLVRDAAGNTVDLDGDGLPDVWPRVALVQLDPTDPAGLRMKSPPVAIPAAVDPTPFLPSLLGAGVAPNAVVPAQRLSIVVRPAAVDATDPAHPKRLPVMPEGKYKVVLMNATGQVWQIPNEAGPAALDPRAVCAASCAPGQVRTASQGRSFAVVKPQAPPPTGEIDGTLTVSGLSAPGAGGPAFRRAYVFAYSVKSPPPFGRPVSADVHEVAEFAGTAPGSMTVNYQLRALPKDDYLVTALVDTRGDFALDPLLFAAAPGEGAVVGAHPGSPSTVHVDAAPVPSIAVIAAVSTQNPPLPPRPSFVLLDSTGATVSSDVQGLASNGGAVRLRLHAQSVLTPTLWPTPEPDPAAFPIAWAACDLNNKPLDLNGDNLPDLNVRVTLLKLAADGVSPERSPEGDVTAIPAVVDPMPFLGGALTCVGGAPVTKVFSDLAVAVTPAAVRISLSGQQTLLTQIPPGRYQLVLASPTGQVWRVPNELAAAAPRAPALAAQGVAISVAPGPVATGTIAGSLHLTGSYTSTGAVLISAWSMNDPPPSLAQTLCGAPACGTGMPLASRFVAAAAVQALVGAPLAGVPFQLPLPAGSYYLTAFMDLPGQFNPAISFMLTPPLGAQAQVLGGSATPTVVQVSAGGQSQMDMVFAQAQASAQAVPVERPMFELATTPPKLPLGATATQPLIVRVPTTAPALPYAQAPAAFHPYPVRDGTGAFAHQGGSAAAPYLVSTQVVFTPLDASTVCAPIALVDMSSGGGNGTICSTLYGAGANPACTSGAATTSAPFAYAPTQLAVGVLPVSCVQNGAVLSQRPTSGRYRVTVVEGLTGQAWSVPNEAGANTPGTGQGGFFLVE